MLHTFFKVEAVELIADDKAPRITQTEEGATYDKIWKKKEVAKVSSLIQVIIYISTLTIIYLNYTNIDFKASTCQFS
jgi:hypothetical protein